MKDLLPAALHPWLPLIEGVAIALAIAVGGWVVSRWAARATRATLEARGFDPALTRFLAALARFLVLAAAIIAALGTVGVETTSVVALLASAGLAIGLALQGSLAHFASGVLLLTFRPFTVGDVIKAGGETGTVEEVGLFATTLLSPDNEVITVPNGAVTSGVIVNYTTRGTRRGAVEVGVDYGAKVADVIAALEAAAARCDLALQDPAPSVAFVGLGASSLDFKVLAFAEAPNYLGMLGQLRTAVYEELDARGIGIPYPQLVVHRTEAA